MDSSIFPLGRISFHVLLHEAETKSGHEGHSLRVQTRHAAAPSLQVQSPQTTRSCSEMSPRRQLTSEQPSGDHRAPGLSPAGQAAPSAHACHSCLSTDLTVMRSPATSLRTHGHLHTHDGADLYPERSASLGSKWRKPLGHCLH